MEKTRRKNPLILILLLVIIVLVAVVAALLLFGGKEPVDPVQPVGTDTPQLSYATQGVTVLEDAETLQAMVDEAARNAVEGMIALDYKNVATSTDGKVFQCHIGNSAQNAFDMYIDICSDMEFSDRLFLSGLIRPGEAFSTIELDRALESGTHTVYCAFTQVEDDHATIHGQVLVSLQLIVE